MQGGIFFRLLLTLRVERNILASSKNDQCFDFLVIGLLSITDSLILILLKQSNKSLKKLTNFAVNVDLLFKRLNEINVKIPSLTELLNVCAAKQTFMGEKDGSSI